jgi:hypothetical protein
MSRSRNVHSLGCSGVDGSKRFKTSEATDTIDEWQMTVINLEGDKARRPPLYHQLISV